MTPEDVQALAKTIAMAHGSAMTYKPPGEMMQTVASEAGFGNWGHSPDKYAEKHWKRYALAAQLMAEKLVAARLEALEEAANIASEQYGAISDDPEDYIGKEQHSNSWDQCSVRIAMKIRERAKKCQP